MTGVPQEAAGALPQDAAGVVPQDAAARREQLKEVFERARVCERCPLSQTRTKVVFGAGNADAELMFVGEAPGANEDLQGLPFVGAAGKLLDQLLGEIGMARRDVFIANVLKCRPPGNRDPEPEEISACQEYLFAQLELIQPTMVCTLGNFATKLLRGKPTGISKLHGQAEVVTVGPRSVRLFPLYHPAAALYTRSTLDLLRADFARIPAVLALGAPEQRSAMVPAPPGSAQTSPPGGDTATAAATDAQPAGAPPAGRAPDDDQQQLGLF